MTKRLYSLVLRMMPPNDATRKRFGVTLRKLVHNLSMRKVAQDDYYLAADLENRRWMVIRRRTTQGVTSVHITRCGSREAAEMCMRIMK
jgi:hypothetical protein